MPNTTPRPTYRSTRQPPVSLSTVGIHAPRLTAPFRPPHTTHQHQQQTSDDAPRRPLLDTTTTRFNKQPPRRLIPQPPTECSAGSSVPSLPRPRRCWRRRRGGPGRPLRRSLCPPGGRSAGVSRRKVSQSVDEWWSSVCVVVLGCDDDGRARKLQLSCVGCGWMG